MTEAERALADAALFAEDALAAAKEAMAGSPNSGTAMMSVFVIMAVAGLWPEISGRPRHDRDLGHGHATGMPVILTFSVPIACCLPLRRPSGGMAHQAAEGIGLGLVWAVVGLVAGIGLYVVVSVAVAVMEVAAARAAQASMEQAVPDPRGPERGA